MPMLRLQLSPSHREAVGDEATFARELSEVVAKACGRKTKFINLEIVWANRYVAGELRPKGWLLTLVASDIFNAEANKKISSEVMHWLNPRIGSDLLDGYIHFVEVEHHMALLGTTWDEVYGGLKQAREERLASEAKGGAQREEDGRGAIKQPVPRPRL